MDKEKEIQLNRISYIINERMKEKQLRFYDLAMKTGLKDDLIVNVAKGNFEPSTEQLEKIANALDLNILYLNKILDRLDYVALNSQQENIKSKNRRIYNS